MFVLVLLGVGSALGASVAVGHSGSHMARSVIGRSTGGTLSIVPKSSGVESQADAIDASTIRRGKPFPVYSEQFQVKTIESDPAHGTVVRQTIVQDLPARRSRMVADGALVQGHLEEIRRCDFDPMGWSLVIGGRTGTSPTEWTCTNTTTNPNPDDCQWSPFWDIQANASYVGVEKVQGVSADKWVYWYQGAEFAFWGTKTTPLKTAEVVADPGMSTWQIEFIDFKAGVPPLEAFAPTLGVKCPQSTPPTGDDRDTVTKERPFGLHTAPRVASVAA